MASGSVEDAASGVPRSLSDENTNIRGSVTDPIYRCPDHGFVTASGSSETDPECPECGQSIETVLSGERRRRLSKFVSGALRHFPEDAGVVLDDSGWAEWDDLVRAVVRKYDWADRDALTAVVETDPKGRFEKREVQSTSGTRAAKPRASETQEADGGTQIRAAYGHSVDVDLADAGGDDGEEGDGADDASEIPDRLYHGTDPANLDSILAEGLKPMGRQEVHLSGTPEEARAVGRRHAVEPVLLGIDAEAMVEDGFRVSKRGTETYTADRVPPKYLKIEER